jgi:hypothetical protein
MSALVHSFREIFASAPPSDARAPSNATQSLAFLVAFGAERVAHIPATRGALLTATQLSLWRAVLLLSVGTVCGECVVQGRGLNSSTL